MHNRIKLIRKALGLNQTDFGAKIGVKQGTVASYESGARCPLDSIIVAICREFHVSEAWLRTGEGEMFIRLSREEELAQYAAQVLTDPDQDIARMILRVMSHLEPSDWERIREVAQMIKPEM